MGEEYGETAPFFYFISHGDPDLVEAVGHGRREAFRDVPEDKNPPNPDDEGVFLLAKLNHALRKRLPTGFFMIFTGNFSQFERATRSF